MAGGRAGGRVEWLDGAPVLAMSDSLAALGAVHGRRGGERTAEQHREDSSRGAELGGFGGEHGADPSAAGSRGNEGKAKAMGLQGGEKCSGCDGEEFKDGLGGRGATTGGG